MSRVDPTGNGYSNPHWGVVLVAFLFFDTIALPAQTPTFRASVESVTVLCSVTGARGGVVPDLRAEDFEIRENGVLQELTSFYFAGKEATPLVVVLLIDTSDSVEAKLEFEQLAAADFLAQILNPRRDLAAVMQFGTTVKLVESFTQNPDRLRMAVFDTRPRGATRLYDAVWLASEELLARQIGRRVLVVLSDGDDTHSIVNEEDAIRRSMDAEAVVYGIGVRDPRYKSDFGALKNLADRTGGRFFDSRADVERLRKAFAGVREAIETQYTLGYVSNNTDPGFREITVRINRRGLKIRHRDGYWVR